MPPGPLLILYCALVVVASLVGGLLPGWMRLGHTRMQVLVSFVAGLMLGVALFHMLVHAAHHTRSLDTAVLWTGIGLLTMFFLIRTLDFHHHEPIREEHVQEGHDHAHPVAPQSALSWAGVAIGFALHTTIDGIALGASVRAEAGHDGGAIPGLGTFLAVLLHKPLDALAVVALMAAGGWSMRSRLLVNLGLAALCPLGALLFWAGAGSGGAFVGSALAFSAGVFLCISLADLLPELQFHSHDRLKLSVALLLGVALAYAIVFLEGDMHHGHAH